MIWATVGDDDDDGGLVVVIGVLTDGVLVMFTWAVEDANLVGEGEKVEGSV